MKVFVFLISFTCLAMLSACGGGGGSEVADTTPPTFVSANTDTTGQKISLLYNETLSATTALTGSFTAISGGAPITISSITTDGSKVVLSLATPISNGQGVTITYTAPNSDSSPSNSATQDSSGNDAASLNAQSVVNNSTVGGSAVSSDINVAINGASATATGTGEYLVSVGSRIAITRSSGGLGSFSTTTKDANGIAATTNLSIHTMSSTTYDVTAIAAPSGGLTTVSFTSLGRAILLRWQ